MPDAGEKGVATGPESIWPEHDKLLHAATGCAVSVQVYGVEMINQTQVMLTGATPTGFRKKDGWPTWRGAKDKTQCVVTIADYQAASDRQKAARAALRSAGGRG